MATKRSWSGVKRIRIPARHAGELEEVAARILERTDFTLLRTNWYADNKIHRAQIEERYGRFRPGCIQLTYDSSKTGTEERQLELMHDIQQAIDKLYPTPD